MDEEVRGWIIQELAQEHTPDQIIFELCSRLNIRWGEAEALVQEVQEADGAQVTLRQAPALTILAAVTLVGGVAIIIRSLAYLNDFASSSIIFYISLWTSAIYYAIGGVLFGTAMIAGSIFGMWNVWRAFLVWIEEQIWPKS